jgi:hypothetical protein
VIVAIATTPPQRISFATATRLKFAIVVLPFACIWGHVAICHFMYAKPWRIGLVGMLECWSASAKVLPRLPRSTGAAFAND